LNQDNVIHGFWDATLEFIGKNLSSLLLCLFVLTVASLVLVIGALIQMMRLRREIGQLRWSTHRLITAEEKRILKRLSDESQRSSD
jgi:hypothetical protein